MKIHHSKYLVLSHKTLAVLYVKNKALTYKSKKYDITMFTA